HSRSGELAREVQCAGEKIAHSYIKTALRKPLSEQALHPRCSELAYCVPRTPGQASHVIEVALDRSHIRRGGINRDCSRQILQNLLLVKFVAMATVVCEIGKFMGRRELAEDVVRADVLDGLERKPLAGFFPKLRL